MAKPENIRRADELSPLEQLKRKFILEQENSLVSIDACVFLKKQNCDFSLSTTDPKVIAQYQKVFEKIKIQGQPEKPIHKSPFTDFISYK